MAESSKARSKARWRLRSKPPFCSRDPARSFSDETLGELERLAARAAPSIENARRFQEARLLADMDALTGLHNQRYFHEELAREVLRGALYREEHRGPSVRRGDLRGLGELRL
jgi:GAF domain-containing protein